MNPVPIRLKQSVLKKIRRMEFINGLASILDRVHLWSEDEYHKEILMPSPKPHHPRHQAQDPGVRCAAVYGLRGRTAQILQCLQSMPWAAFSSRQVASALGLKASDHQAIGTISMLLARLCRAGQLVRVQVGRYVFAAATQPTLFDVEEFTTKVARARGTKKAAPYGNTKRPSDTSLTGQEVLVTQRERGKVAPPHVSAADNECSQSPRPSKARRDGGPSWLKSPLP